MFTILNFTYILRLSLVSLTS